MPLPGLEHLPLIHGEIADYRFDGKILYSYSKPILRTAANIAGNAALVSNITGGNKVPLLIYLSKSPIPDKEARRFSTEQLPKSYTAMAMVSEPGLSQLIIRLLFRFARPPIPMKSFKDDRLALQWLMSYVN